MLRERIPTRLGAALGPTVERIFYNDQLAGQDGNPARLGAMRRGVVAANQALFERGLSPPWIWSPRQCAEFWTSRELGDSENGPDAYSRKSLEVVAFLNDFWHPRVSTEASVLEVGCNAGPNLEGLRKLGFSRLAGVEMSAAALDEMRRAFPALAASATIHHGSAEDVLPTLPERSSDVVFSMAVLLHVHPASNQVMAHMARIARRYVCVVEAETVTCNYVFARNYRRVFERHGCVEVKAAEILPSSFPSAKLAYVGYTARLFQVPR